MAQRYQWKESVNEFLRFAFEFAKSSLPSTLSGLQHPREIPQSRSQKAQEEVEVEWSLYDAAVALDLVGENQTVINRLNGHSTCRDETYSD